MRQTEIRIDDIDYDLADRVQEIIDSGPADGMTPSQVARKAKASREDVMSMLAWLIRNVHITHDDRGAWTHYYSRRRVVAR